MSNVHLTDSDMPSGATAPHEKATITGRVIYGSDREIFENHHSATFGSYCQNCQKCHKGACVK